MLDCHHSSGEAIHQTSSFAHVERVWELYQAKYGDLSLCMNLFSLHFVLWAIRIRSTSTLSCASNSVYLLPVCIAFGNKLSLWLAGIAYEYTAMSRFLSRSHLCLDGLFARCLPPARWLVALYCSWCAVLQLSCMYLVFWLVTLCCSCKCMCCIW